MDLKDDKPGKGRRVPGMNAQTAEGEASSPPDRERDGVVGAQHAAPAVGETVAAATPAKRTVREWTESTGTRRSLVVGAARARGWTADAEISEREFRSALEAFAKRPLGGERPQRKRPATSGDKR